MVDEGPKSGIAPLLASDPLRVGPYQVVGRLGAGGMGVVLAALNSSGQRVAVKLVHPAHSSDPEFRARFTREIAVLQKVRSSSVAQVLDADPDADRPWLATEYVPGLTLDAHVRHCGPLAGDSLLGLAARLAEALTAIHAAGVVHRDLKPSNIILAPQGPRVLDFGIARALDETSMTSTGMLVGSPGWISPEEYRSDEAGPPSDVYGWGLLLVHAVTGAPPYGKGRPEVIASRVLGDSVETEALPESLRDLVDRTLAKDPAERPTSPEILAAVVELWQNKHEQVENVTSTEPEDITTLLTQAWSVPTVIEAAWPDGPEPKTAKPSTPEHSRKRPVTITAVLILVFLAAMLGLRPLLTGPTRPPSSNSTTSASITETPSFTPDSTPISSSAPPATDQPVTFEGIKLTIPTAWRMTEVSKSIACLESPTDHGVSGPWGYPCRPDSLVLEIHPEPLTWPVFSIDGGDQGWVDGNAILPCLAGGTVSQDPKYVPSLSDTQGVSARIAHDVLAYGGYATAGGGKVIQSDLTPLADRRKAAHRKWNVPCFGEHRTFVQEAWWLPVSRIAFYSFSVGRDKSAAYERIVGSVDLRDYTKSLKTQRKPAYAGRKKLGLLSPSNDGKSLIFRPARRQWVDENGRHVAASHASNWYAADIGSPITAPVSPYFKFYSLRGGLPDNYQTERLTDLTKFINEAGDINPQNPYPVFTVSFDEEGHIYKAVQEFQA